MPHRCLRSGSAIATPLPQVQALPSDATPPAQAQAWPSPCHWLRLKHGPRRTTGSCSGLAVAALVAQLKPLKSSDAPYWHLTPGRVNCCTVHHSHTMCFLCSASLSILPQTATDACRQLAAQAGTWESARELPPLGSGPEYRHSQGADPSTVTARERTRAPSQPGSGPENRHSQGADPSTATARERTREPSQPGSGPKNRHSTHCYAGTGEGRSVSANSSSGASRQELLPALKLHSSQRRQRSWHTQCPCILASHVQHG